MFWHYQISNIVALLKNNKLNQYSVSAVIGVLEKSSKIISKSVEIIESVEFYENKKPLSDKIYTLITNDLSGDYVFGPRTRRVKHKQTKDSPESVLLLKALVNAAFNVQSDSEAKDLLKIANNDINELQYKALNNLLFKSSSANRCIRFFKI